MSTWTDRVTLRVSLMPPPEATHWSVDLVTDDGSMAPGDATGERMENGRVTVEFRGLDEELKIGAVGVALTNDQNIRGARFPVPQRP